MGKMAILGGTFDPVHWGHLLLAEAAQNQFSLDRVIWFPDRCPPHKSRQGGADFQQRWEMVNRAIADRPDFILLPANPVNLTEPSYAIETFLYLQPLAPQAQWFWIVGLDAFQTLPKWQRRAELIPSCHWLVAPRPLLAGAEPETVVCEQVAQQIQAQGLQIEWQLLKMPSLDLSSSLIRHYCQRGRSIHDLVPDAVRTYIEAQKLYHTDLES